MPEPTHARTTPSAESSAEIARIRQFNRAWTRSFGLLAERVLESPFSLTEARVLYELANREDPAATRIARDLLLDAGYLSRILRRFERDGLLRPAPSAGDRRRKRLELTSKGRELFAAIDRRQRETIEDLLAPLGAAARQRLSTAVTSMLEVLGSGMRVERNESPRAGACFTLREAVVGDLGWISWRHGVVYAAEQGWDVRFEALCARIVADFVERFDPTGERCWVAVRDGANVGSIMLVRQTATVAKLRLLLVEPSARGLGIGTALVRTCLDFARACGYERVTLFTVDVLQSARRIYEAEGFRRVHREPNREFGEGLTAETYVLELGTRTGAP